MKRKILTFQFPLLDLLADFAVIQFRLRHHDKTKIVPSCWFYKQRCEVNHLNKLYIVQHNFQGSNDEMSRSSSFKKKDVRH